jgi:hypothetical protein
VNSAPLRFLRRLAPFILIVELAACGGSSPPPPPQVFAPLDYSYLPPIVLNISNITVQNDYVPDPGAATLIGEDPEAPANALSAMLQHRLVANGTPGNGVVTIENASLEQVGGNYVGVMTVRLDVASLDGLKTGFTEASVSVTQTAPDSDADQNQVQAVLYGVTKQLMDQMNVQLQYQIQRNMGSWISYTPNAATPGLNGGAAGNGGIQATPLTAPGAAQPGAPQTGAPQPSVSPPGAPLPLQPPLQTNGLPLGSQSLGTLPATSVTAPVVPSTPQ